MDENIIRDNSDIQSDEETPKEESNFLENTTKNTEEYNADSFEEYTDVSSSDPNKTENTLDYPNEINDDQTVNNTDSIVNEGPQHDISASQSLQSSQSPQNSYTHFKQQQMHYDQYYGQQTQYGQQYRQYSQHEQQYVQYNNQPVIQQKKKAAPPLTERQKKIVWLLRIGIILIAMLFVYCIISDAIAFKYYEPNTSSSSNDNSNKKENPVIYRENKPSDNTENDKKEYTVKEIADMVCPSIVQIQASSKESGGSTGSGIILTEDGYILTNAHVVNGYDEITITLYNSEKPVPAEVVGYDSKSDLAVLKTEKTDLTPAMIGYASELSVGEDVVAIGNPAGLKDSVTKGIVSALGRQIRSGATGFYMDCIQTDAAISPGNSGGALVNMYGQVVGVTSSKYGNAYFGGTYEGLGFAISIDQAMPIAMEIIDLGYVSGRVRIGITFASLTDDNVREEFAANFNLTESPCKEGIWITDISPDCDIANSELDVNDVILSVNGEKVDNYDQLQEIIKNCKAGDELTAKCRRYTFGDTKDELNHKDFTIKFKLMEDKSGDF